jgi:hypothetical protein
MESINQQNTKGEVMTLILADLRNRKLVMGLDAIGLSTDEFNTDLSILIFSKMGIANQHEVLMVNWYEDRVFHILDIDLPTFREHHLFLAITLYDSLKEMIRKLQTELMAKSKPTFSCLDWIEFRTFDN